MKMVRARYCGQPFLSRKRCREIVDELRRVNVNFHLESPSSIVTGLNPVKHYTVRDSFITNMPLEVAKFEDLRSGQISAKS